MFFILFVITLILYALHNLIYNSDEGKLIDKIPGPKRFLFFGNAFDFIVSQVAFFSRVRHLATNYDGIYRLWAFHRRNINIYNPEDIEIVLSSQKHLSKSFVYKFLHPWLNSGLLTSTGEKWHQRRKILTPAFHFNILNQFSKIFMEHSDNLVEKLKKTDSQDVNILPFITDFTLNSICETAMGTNLNYNKSSAVEYKNGIYKLGHFLLYRLVRIWFHPDVTFNMTKIGIEQKSTLNMLHKFTKDVIDKRREERILSGDKFVAEDFTEERIGKLKKRLAMLDLLLSVESEGKIDEQGIIEEVDTFMFEGHDTITMAIKYCLMLLANNPEVQNLAYEEVTTIFGDKSTVTIEDLNKMNYLEMCIKETLRLYPSVPYIGRYITEELKLNKYTVPPNTSCHIHIFDLHRNPKIYPNPDKFDPNRFLPENCAKRHTYAYVPFSAGPRNCIGKKFAILEGKAVISTILRNFYLEAVTRPNDIIFSMDLVLRTITPIKIKFIPRNL